MLRKKEYTAILESAKSKDEIVALFNSLYSPLRQSVLFVKYIIAMRTGNMSFPAINAGMGLW